MRLGVADPFKGFLEFKCFDEHYLDELRCELHSLSAHRLRVERRITQTTAIHKCSNPNEMGLDGVAELKRRIGFYQQQLFPKDIGIDKEPYIANAPTIVKCLWDYASQILCSTQLPEEPEFCSIDDFHGSGREYITWRRRNQLLGEGRNESDVFEAVKPLLKWCEEVGKHEPKQSQHTKSPKPYPRSWRGIQSRN